MNKFVKVCAAFVAAAAFSTPALAQTFTNLFIVLSPVQ